MTSLNSKDDVFTLLVHLGYLAYDGGKEEVEQALCAVVVMAYLSCVDHYRRFEELASGKGYSDLLFVPGNTSAKPALLIELKWDKSAEGAVMQIKEQNYAEFARRFGYEGQILLIGINYNTRTKKHSCKIESIMNDRYDC